ncbi:hypothetical protein Mcup_1100 [Metallosphaera cuprina Ar-4]|uniref:Uncharacterized protein n=1 Tax=Metallosphaera cuprina (strain Ar-4) TaxID=1006006 RepID=F4G307_METCR|nr:hypothetical protein Mcup_1100 [Metallosphaera cuprina Ar-4]
MKDSTQLNGIKTHSMLNLSFNSMKDSTLVIYVVAGHAYNDFQLHEGFYDGFQRKR